MRQYIELLKKIRSHGVEKPSARENMPPTIGLSNAIISVNLQDGFPLLTTKKMFLKGIIVELIWFLRGDTNIKYLVDRGVNIWNKEAYKWYLKQVLDTSQLTMEEFINNIKVGNILLSTHKGKYSLGDLGKVYGHQWRNQNGTEDQIVSLIENIKKTPYSRYHIVDAWNKSDFSSMALPPCHLLYQFIARPHGDNIILDLNMYQRSCDTFLGVPFNIASSALLLTIIAKITGTVPGVLNWIGGDTHIYTTHKDQCDEQINRIPFPLPDLNITKDLNTIEDIEGLCFEDFELFDYRYHPAIKAELSVGL